MGNTANDESFLRGVIGRIRRRKSMEEPARPISAALAMLDRLHSGEHPDYCLYLRPPAGGAVPKTGPLSIDLEEMMIKALDPLPVVMLDENGASAGESPLPDEAFLTLANRARILCVAPMPDHRYLQRLRLMTAHGLLGRTIFMMPEPGTLGTADWPALWPAAAEAATKIGTELSSYTPGGWLFRVDKEGKSVTFRPIVNPNPQKVAKAVEGICGEME